MRDQGFESSAGEDGTAPPRRDIGVLLLILMILALFGGGAELSPMSAFVVIRECPLSLLILLAGTGLGLGLLRVVRIQSESGIPRLVLATGLGLGVLAILVLALGTLGFFSPIWWWGVVCACAVPALPALRAIAGLVKTDALRKLIQKQGNETLYHPAFIWIILPVIAAFAFVFASFPPGVFWPAEGNGYDVLEYHLGALRDYLDAGRITYLPHNIYSNFPFGVEMLYLLGMILRGDPLKAAFTAQLLHAMLGMLAGVAAWCAARAALCEAEPARRNAAHIAGIVTVTCPLVLYVGALAYVENGLILFTALALWAILEAGRRGQSQPIRWFGLAGALAGFAFGCKYIAAVQVVIPLVIATSWAGHRKQREPGIHPSGLPRSAGGRAMIAFGVATMLTMSPWLIRNAVNTGNPVFPLARSVFPERAGIWNEDGAARWAEGHLPGPEHRSAVGRAERLWNQVLWNPLYGPVMGLGVLVAVVGVVWRRSVAVVPCVILLVGTLITWIAFTHLVDRFAIVAIVPAAVLTAVVIGTAIPPLPRPLFALMVGGANLVFFMLSTLDMNKLVTARDSVGVSWFTEGEWPTHQHVPVLNQIARGGEKVLMVADARRFYLDRGVDYCVVFNRNPFAEAAEQLDPKSLLGWLWEHGYRHIYVNWSEMNRLRRSRYGFWKSVDAGLFERLEENGLIRERTFELEPGGRTYGAMYRIEIKAQG